MQILFRCPVDAMPAPRQPGSPGHRAHGTAWNGPRLRASCATSGRQSLSDGGFPRGRTRDEAENVVALVAHAQVGGSGDPLPGDFGLGLGVFHPVALPKGDDHDLVASAVVIQAYESAK